MPVDVGPFQQVVGVSWGGGLPSILTIHEYHQGWPRWAFTYSGFILTMKVLTDLPTAGMGGDGEPIDTYKKLNGVTVATHSSIRLAGPDFRSGGTSVFFDLRKVREAFALGPLQDGKGEVPAFFDLEIDGYVNNGGENEGAGGAWLTVESWGGRDAFARQLERSPDNLVWSVFEGSGKQETSFSGSFPVTIGAQPSSMGFPIKTLRVRLDRLGFGTDEGEA